MLDRRELLSILKAEYDHRMDDERNAWEALARENQKIPPGDWNIWLVMAGRGFGKTRAAAEAVRKLVKSGDYKRIALIGDTIREAQSVMVEGESGILSISHPRDRLKYLKSKRQLVWPNGAVATIYGAERPEQLRGPQFDFAWIDEIAKFDNPQKLFDQLNLALRLGPSPKVIMTTTPRSISFLTDLMKRKDVYVTRGTSMENRANLSKNFLDQLEYMKGTALEAQEVYGEIVEEKDGLWTFDDISNAYKTPDCDFTKVIISVDPSVKGNGAHDETGIVVCGIDELGVIYILDDLSTHAPPDEWAQIVTFAYEKYKANYVLYEANQGGDLVSSLLKKYDPDIALKSVHATMSKRARAIPVHTLYTKKMVKHAKQMRALESQMLSFPPKRRSPDRVDALVWGVRELSNKRKQTNIWSVKLNE